MVGQGVGCGGGRNKLTVCRDSNFLILCSSISYSSPHITSNVIIICQAETRERKAEERGGKKKGLNEGKRGEKIGKKEGGN